MRPRTASAGSLRRGARFVWAGRTVELVSVRRLPTTGRRSKRKAISLTVKEVENGARHVDLHYYAEERVVLDG